MNTNHIMQSQRSSMSSNHYTVQPIKREPGVISSKNETTSQYDRGFMLKVLDCQYKLQQNMRNMVGNVTLMEKWEMDHSAIMTEIRSLSKKMDYYQNIGNNHGRNQKAESQDVDFQTETS